MNLKYLLYVFVILFTFLTGCSKKEDGTQSGNNKETKSESVNNENISFDKPIMVEFKIAGGLNGTVNAVYYKTKARSRSNIEIGGQKMTATAYFDGGDYMYIVSEVAGMKTGMKIKKGEFGKKEGEIDALTFKDKLKEMDKIGTEEILGKMCDIYRSKDGKYQMSIFNELVPLKFSSGDGKMVMEATKYETDVKVDDSDFNPPEDVNYIDAGNMMKDMKKPNNIDNLKDKAKEYEDIMKKYKK